MAHYALQESLCSGCGQPRDESMRLDNDGAYDVSVLRCHACAATTQRAQAFGEQGVGDRAGLYFTARLDPHAQQH